MARDQGYTLDDIAALQETDDIECKLAAGKDGNGAVPKDMWETYSAFANTDGGSIFLGLKQDKKTGKFSVAGIQDIPKLKKQIFDHANNRQTVNVNLLTGGHLHEHIIQGKSILEIAVPKAKRKDKPVYIGSNPLTGSYIRQHEGDYKLDEEAVRRMLAEQSDESPDSVILPNYDLDDLDLDSLKAYRNTFASLKPSHPFLAGDNLEFLEQIRGWRKDRETGEEGLTMAGLLMFGKLRSIHDYLPYYILDYQERPEAKTEKRWIDRVTTDGSWSGNLYDFYRKVYPKLVADLKVPFELEGPTRRDETAVHKALREALVNTLIHADYKGRLSILAVKRPDMFGFRNPGLMRVPIEYAIRGGDSDCRNRILQDMFRYIGAGEQAGSGIPEIFQSWESQHWRAPRIREDREPSEQTVFELHMVSLYPQEAFDGLEALFGSRFKKLTEMERNILVVCYAEESIDHKRIKELYNDHPSDISKALQKLAKESFLKTDGTGRGMTYRLPEPESKSLISSPDLDGSSPDLDDNSPDLDGSSPDSDPLSKLTPEEKAVLGEVLSKKNAPRHKMEQAIISLCKMDNQTLDRLAQYLSRRPAYLRDQYLTGLVETERLKHLYPDPNHPKQAYVHPDRSTRNDGEEQS
ncbi:MAG: hypothetical protein EA357_00860 [Micavibrio sp.]|nr:MAG: hypothetical protein EA357_00860 [Micavibrio sp.]